MVITKSLKIEESLFWELTNKASQEKQTSRQYIETYIKSFSKSRKELTEMQKMQQDAQENIKRIKAERKQKDASITPEQKQKNIDESCDRLNARLEAERQANQQP